MWHKFTVSATRLRWMLNSYPPNIGAGIRLREMTDDFRYARVEMPLTFLNRNYVGVQFGGSLYSMCDPLYMLMLMNILGNQFIVWDKASKIEYLKPGKSKVTAEFAIEDELIESLRALQPEEKRIFDLSVDVKDTEGQVVAHVIKTEYVKRKPISGRSN